MLLALESATSEVGVALADADGVRAAAVIRPGRRHAETLHPMIADVVARAGVSLADCEAVAVDVGPGLFTGLRVAIAAAKAIAFALSLPVVPLLSTDVLLAAARHAGALAAVVDLRRGEIAWARRLGDAPRRGTVEELADELAVTHDAILAVGDGALRHGERLAALVAAAGGRPPTICGEEFAAPPVAALARLGVARLAEGATADPFDLAPCYLRDADVRINWTTRDTDAPRRAGGAVA